MIVRYKKELFSCLNHPYYIFTYPFRETSSGIRALHYLCHALNAIGEEAYVTTNVIDSNFRTPFLTPELFSYHVDTGRQPIVVYPEVVSGNPLNANLVVRYLLNVPGYFTQQFNYDVNDIFFTQSKDLLLDGMNALVLTTPPVDTRIFNSDGVDESQRVGTCFYADAYLQDDQSLFPITDDAIEISPRVRRRSHRELAKLFRSVTLMYTYEPSAVSIEARLCGCPVVYLPNLRHLAKPLSHEIDILATAWGVSGELIEKARSELGEFWDAYQRFKENFWIELDTFVLSTQTWAKSKKYSNRNMQYCCFGPDAYLVNQGRSLSLYDYRGIDVEQWPTTQKLMDKRLIYSNDFEASSKRAINQTRYNVVLSIIICSVDDERFTRITRVYHELLIAIPHEIIRIDDATSLCEGYNRGIARSQGDYLVFSHDDIDIWTPDFGLRLLRHLDRCDIVGVAGTDFLVDADTPTLASWTWGAAGPQHVFGRIITFEPKEDKYYVSLYGIPTVLVEGMQALDGVFIAMRRQVVEALHFDEETFDGFHLYDIDFTYRAFRQGFRVGVFNDIAIVHYSGGKYDEEWLGYHRRFLRKFADVLPKGQMLKWKAAIVGFRHPDEVLTFYKDSIESLSPIITIADEITKKKRNVKSDSSNIAIYRYWCARRQVGEGWAEIVAERMVRRWRAQPTFHLVIWCEPAQQAALADTIESLGQQLYERWGLSVLAPFDCPDDSFAELPNMEWIKVETDADAALHNALEASALDWFALLEPGDRLASHALLKIADYVNHYPAWRFIYLDEDQIDARGERREPVFRPQFDSELLLATHYLGDCCWMRRDSVFAADDALAYLPGLTTFQAALNVLKNYGRTAIGHIADVLYHRTVARLQTADPDALARAQRRLIEQYLIHRGVAATVEEALLPGSWRVIYQHSCQPKVSIVILAKDALDRLDRCLRRLLGETAYPDYEVLVVDCGSEVDDTLDLYAELEARYPQRLRVTSAQGPFSASAYRNQGARQANGEVLVFLSASALVVQPQWIERLLHHALRDEVGIVGARMTTPDHINPFVHGTAQALGMRGVAGPLFTGLSLKATGPLGRAQVDQTVSAVSAECLAIRREVFETLEGFDERFVVAHADTDLCLRAAERGYRTVWTPFANLAWLGEYPIATGFSHDEIVRHGRADADRMFERWLPKLATDPAYNPNLSLAEPHRIELELTPGWDTTFHTRPRLLGFPVDESGCGLYRVYAPLWLLEHQAHAECTLVKPGARLPELAELERLAPDTVFYQTTLSDMQLEAMRRYRRFHKSFKVFDLDDLKHNVPDANSLKERLVRDMKYRHRKALQECDRLTVSTEPLAEACRQWIGDIRIVPNRLERARWGHLQNQRRIGPKPRVGWAGAQQHHGDLAFITDVVKQTCDEVDWIFFGMCLDELRPYVREVHDWVHLNDYPTKLASLDLDLAVAPLEYHPFNEAKSNLRVLEHGILGRPMVCTDIYPYRNAPVQRVPNESDAWVEAIRERVHDLDAAEREGAALRAWVLEHYILDDHTDDWLRALRP